MPDRVFDIASENLGKTTRFQLTLANFYRQNQKDLGIDAKVKLHLLNEQLEFYVLFRKEIRKHQLPKILEIATAHAPFLLIAEKLSPKIKARLIDKEINWLDAAGNIFVITKNHYILVDRHDANHLSAKRERHQDRAFTKTGLKVIFLFLQNEAWLQKTYREIAQEANVALGTISYVFNGLEKRGYLVKKNSNTYELVQKEKIIDTWITAFETKLKPKLEIGNFTFIDQDTANNWKNIPLDDQSVWGGEAGGDLLTGMIRPQILTLYTTNDRGNLMKKLRVKPDPNGEIQVLSPYWRIQAGEKTAPPLVIYSDLMLTGEQRNFQIAKEIYARFIQA